MNIHSLFSNNLEGACMSSTRSNEEMRTHCNAFSSIELVSADSVSGLAQNDSKI